MTDHPTVSESAPVFRIISDDATDEEIAAILAVVTAVTSRNDRDAESGTSSTWSGRRARHRNVRGVFVPGPSGWRTSYWPR